MNKVKHESLKILSTFSKKEIIKFKKYINGIYSEKKKTILIFSELIKDFNKLKKGNIERNEIERIVFLGESNATQKLSNGLKDLEKILKEFLIWTEIRQNKMIKNEILLPILWQRKIRKSFNQSWQELEKEIEKSKHIFKYLDLFRLYYNTYFSWGVFIDKVPIENLRVCVKYLEIFFFYMKNKILGEARARNKIRKEILNHHDFNLNNLDYYPSYGVVLFNAYSLQNKCWKKLDKTTFEESWNYYAENFSKFDMFIQKEIWNSLINILNYVSDIPQERKYKMTFELYNFGVKHGLFLTDGIMDIARFMSIVNYCCLLKEFNWLEDFIQKFELYLKIEYQSECKILAEAYIYFNKNEFSNTIDTLKEIRCNYPTNWIRAKILLSQSHFEINSLNHPNFVISYLESFHRFNKRNKMLFSTGLLEQTNNFISLAKKILTKKHRKVNLLKILYSKNHVGKKWLENKINKN